MHTLCQKWHVPICFLWWTWILVTLESHRMSLIRWFFLLWYALWPSSRRAGCRSPGRRWSVTRGSVSTLSQWLCLGCDSWPISNLAAVVQWRMRPEEFIFYARFWRCYPEQIVVPYITIFPPMWPFVNKLLFYRQLVFCHVNVISHMRTMSAAGRLLAGNIFWRMAALSIVLLCHYRKAFYAITGVAIVMDVTEVYSMCVHCLLVGSVSWVVF